MSFYFQFTAFFFFCILNIFGQSRTHYCRCWKVYQMSECRSIEERQRGKVIVDKKNVSKTCWLNWICAFLNEQAIIVCIVLPCIQICKLSRSTFIHLHSELCKYKCYARIRNGLVQWWIHFIRWLLKPKWNSMMILLMTQAEASDYLQKYLKIFFWVHFAYIFKS